MLIFSMPLSAVSQITVISPALRVRLSATAGARDAGAAIIADGAENAFMRRCLIANIHARSPA